MSNPTVDQSASGNGAPLPRDTAGFQQWLEALPAGAYTCDPDGRITAFNTQAVALWGRSPKLNDAADRYCGSLRLYSPDGSPLPHDQCWMALAIRNNRRYAGKEVIVERPDGRRLAALSHAMPVYDDRKNVVGSINVLVDITERKRAERALTEAGRQKDEFLATLAHELRNPLSPIRNAVEFMTRNSPLTNDLQWATDVINRQVAHMVRLIDDLLDVSRVARNELELNRQRIELSEALQVALETSRPLIDARKQNLSVSMASEPIYLDADPVRLSQVVSNLLNNAAKYTERGGRIWITTARQGDNAVISVRDDGIGLDRETLPHMFDMFAQADRSVERSGQGLGIGLTLARRLVELHGGSIDAFSDGLGKGSEFVVKLPLLDAVGGALSARYAGGRMPTVSALRILIADDDSDNAMAMSRLLGSMGNEIQTAADGIEALRFAEVFRPQVLLLDIGLPKLNGYDLAQRIREQPWSRGMILIAITGLGQQKDSEFARASGFDHHLLKPADIATLLNVLARVTENDAAHT